MCGIAGIVNFSDSSRSVRDQVRTMTSGMHHRGPDATGYYDNENISFGHNRLSIIDLAECSNQPMADHTGRFHIVFNGEIYNYRELRKRLPDYPYHTNGDTETILAAYSSWGVDCVKELTGMFAFAIWDEQESSLFLARDRLGVKPLYYYENNGTIVFASELRAILNTGLIDRRMNPLAASEFLQFQSITFPSTIVSGVSSLEAATWMLLSKHEKVINKYWNFNESQQEFPFDDPELVRNKIKQLLHQSVERRMVSDVPVAAFLSGGIDSSAVVGLMSEHSSGPINTFNIAFEEKDFDESTYARIIASKFRTSHQEIRLKAQHFLDDLHPALKAMDSPTGDGVNSYVVSSAISKHGIKVAMSGTGGDELFAGYPFFRHYTRLMEYAKWWALATPVRQLAGFLMPKGKGRFDRLAQILRANNPGIASFYPSFRQVVSRRMLSQCTSLPVDTHYPMQGALHEERQLSRLPRLSQVSIAEYMGYTQHTLLRDMDQMSMATSLEVREPFFDHELINFVLLIPDEIKYPSYPKKLLVESLGDLLPPEIVHRKKQGFEFPWKIWMKTELRSFCEDRLAAIGERDFIRKEQLMNTWQRFLKNDESVRWMELWLFVVLENWLQQNDVR